MGRMFQTGGRMLSLLAVMMAGAPVARAGEVIDRIIATVDHRAILESEWDQALRLECFLDGRPLPQTEAERRAALDRLVDQALISGHMENAVFRRATPEEVAKRVAEIRRQNAAWNTEEGWRAALSGYGLTPEDVNERVGEQLDILRFIDYLFRPTIHIDKRAVESYYQEQLIPQLKGMGAGVTPLREVAEKIQEILVQQRIGELLNSWLRNLRVQARVQVR